MRTSQTFSIIHGIFNVWSCDLLCRNHCQKFRVVALFSSTMNYYVNFYASNIRNLLTISYFLGEYMFSRNFKIIYIPCLGNSLDNDKNGSDYCSLNVLYTVMQNTSMLKELDGVAVFLFMNIYIVTLV